MSVTFLWGGKNKVKKKAIKALALTLAGLAAGAGVTGGVVAAVKKSNEEKANTPINHEEENTNQELPIDNTDPVVQTLEVTFDLNQGEGEIATQRVAENQKAERPANNPSRTGYEFLDWYLNETQFDFNTPITNDITLQAKWIKLHTVTFNNNGAETSTTVRDQETVTATTPNDREGYEFGGWYLDETEFNFDTPITDDITLQAKWNQIVLQARGTLDKAEYFNIENGVLCGLTEAGKNYAMEHEEFSVVIPNGVKEIHGYNTAGCGAYNTSAFHYHDQYSDFSDRVISVTLPDDLITIGEYAFARCSGLTTIHIPDTVITIGSNAFSDCSGLTSIVIPDSVTTTGVALFYNCPRLVIYCEYYCDPLGTPESWDSYWAWGEANSFENIYWGSQWEYVNGEPTLYVDTDFQYEKVGDNYRITKCLVSYCDVVIPEAFNGGAVTEIADDAFSDSNLDTIYCSFVRDDYDWLPCYSDVYFQGEWIYDHDGNPTVAMMGEKYFEIDGDGVLTGLSSEGAEYIDQFYQSDGSVVVVIPEGVTAIYGNQCTDGSGMFYSQSAFTYNGNDLGYHIDEVILPESLTRIGDYAFYGCSNMTVDIPESVEVSQLAYGE